MATRITDSTLVSKFAPVPKSVSGGEPGFISIHSRIFWIPINVGGMGGAYALDQVEHTCWIRDYFANVRLCLFCTMNFSHTCLFFKYASKSRWDHVKNQISKTILCSIPNFATGPFMTFTISVLVYQILIKYFSRDFHSNFIKKSWSSSYLYIAFRCAPVCMQFQIIINHWM